MLRAATIVTLAAAALLAPATATAATNITVKTFDFGATFTELARAYPKPSGVVIRIFPPGNEGLTQDVARGRINIAVLGRDPLPSDPGGLVFSKFGRDPLCIVTHRDNRLPNLSGDGVRAIFTRRTPRWEQVPGATVGGVISAYLRPAPANVMFQRLFLGQEQAQGVPQVSLGMQRLELGRRPDAVSWLSWADSANVNRVAHEGVACNLRNAKSGQYGPTRNMWMAGRQDVQGPQTRRFIRWIRTSPRARAIIAKRYAPLR